MRLGWDMKREEISSLGSIQRGNKRWENIHHELRRRKLQELWWFQVEELKVSREIWTDHNEIVNHLPVSLMQVLLNYLLLHKLNNLSPNGCETINFRWRSCFCLLPENSVHSLWLDLVKPNQFNDQLIGQGHQLFVAFDSMTQKLKFCTYSTHSLWSIGTWAPVLAIMAIETLYLTDKSKILHWKLPRLWLCILSQCQRVSQPMAACDVYINHYMWTVSEDMGRGGGRLHWFHALFCLVGGAIRVILTHYWEFEQWH